MFLFSFCEERILSFSSTQAESSYLIDLIIVLVWTALLSFFPQNNSLSGEI